MLRKLVCSVLFAWVIAIPYARGQTPLVFVSITPQKYFAQHIGGEHIAVHVMVGAGQNPVTYEPSMKQMAALRSAVLYHRAGIAFENAWMSRIVAANPAIRIVDARDAIELLPMASIAEVFGQGSAQHGSGGVMDPHFWTDPMRVKAVCRQLMVQLISLDPAHRGDYEKNFHRFASQLDILHAEIKVLLADKQGASFMVFHPAWGYFAHAYGLRQVPIEIRGRDPGAKTLAAVIDYARKQHIQAVIVQKQFSTRAAAVVAKAIHAEVISVDPMQEDYLQSMRTVANVIAGAAR